MSQPNKVVSQQAEPQLEAGVEGAQNGGARTADIVRIIAREEAVIRSYIRRLIGNRSHSEDIFQEAFLRIYEKSKSAVIREPLAYIYRIARNLINDSHQRDKRTPETLTEEMPCQQPSPEDAVESQRRMEMFLASIEKMPRLRREVFLRRRLYGQSYQEIGSELGLSVKAVEKHISRALAYLNDRDINSRSSQLSLRWRNGAE